MYLQSSTFMHKQQVPLGHGKDSPRSAVDLTLRTACAVLPCRPLWKAVAMLKREPETTSKVCFVCLSHVDVI
jgi:hypothetical protein